MIELYADVLINNNLLELLSKRGRNRVVKEALRFGLEHWNEKILPGHFTTQGQDQYPNVFTRRKPKTLGVSLGLVEDTSKPRLVQTGQFRDRILKYREIRATGKSASIRFQFGRPEKVVERINKSVQEFYKEYDKPIRSMDSKTRNHIFSYMKGKHITFDQARHRLVDEKKRKIMEKIYKRNTYSGKTKKKMSQGISAMNDKDRKIIYKVMENFVVDNWKTLGKANIKVNK